MSKHFKGRKIVLAGLVVALGTAMFVNWYYTKPSVDLAGKNTPKPEEISNANLGDAQYVNGGNVTEEPKGETDYFSDAALKRTKTHDEVKETLMKVFESKDADEKSKEAARKKLEAFTESLKLETETENLIQAKTGGKCLVQIGNGAEVIVPKGTLNNTVLLQIQEIILSKTKISAENVTIIESK